MSKKHPIISIITVVYNGVDLLEGTIKSVIAQDTTHVEYIIVDGASTDGTLAIIEKYEAHIDRWISEPDKGLYDAMNKALQLATGDFVWFMNCGDHIYTPDTVTKILAAYTPDTDILYGEVMMVDDARKPIGTRSEITAHRLPKDLHWKSLQYGMVVSHQAFLPRRRIAPSYIDGNLSADIDWVITCLKRSKKNTATQLVLATFLIGGVSKQRHWEGLKNRYTVLAKHYGFVPNLFHHCFIVLRAAWYKLIRKQEANY